MNVDEILFRASANGQIMTESKSSLTELQSKKIVELSLKDNLTEKQKSELDGLIFKRDNPSLSETTKTYLKQLYREKKYGRRKDIISKFLEKGLAVEEESITLLSQVEKTFYKKNESYLSNEFICGTPDLFIGESIDKAETIIDIKSSWDLFTFPFQDDKINPTYYWQMQSYMSLTGAKNAILAYCLVDTPQPLIYKEWQNFRYKSGILDETNELALQALEAIESLAKYDDIPLEERIIKFNIKRNDLDIERLNKRVLECRNYIKSLM